MAAIGEGLPITSIREVLAEHYALKVSYSNLREWIRRAAGIPQNEGGSA